MRHCCPSCLDKELTLCSNGQMLCTLCRKYFSAHESIEYAKRSMGVFVKAKDVPVIRYTYKVEGFL